jgi:predicted alpha/beta-hydrolase family hydrolase
MERLFTLKVGDRAGSVDGLLLTPEKPRLLYVFAHGAGAGMRHSFMNQMSEKLLSLGVATLRFNFPYMQDGTGRPNPAPILETTVRAAIEYGAHELPGVPMTAGGKSMGGRMTSQLLSKDHDLPIQGLAFVGFPLHQPGKPGRARAEHLFDVVHPMLFLQGTRDTLADITLMREVTGELGERARLHVIEGADHSFAVLKKSGRTFDDVLEELAEVILDFGVGLR